VWAARDAAIDAGTETCVTLRTATDMQWVNSIPPLMTTRVMRRKRGGGGGSLLITLSLEPRSIGGSKVAVRLSTCAPSCSSDALSSGFERGSKSPPITIINFFPRRQIYETHFPNFRREAARWSPSLRSRQRLEADWLWSSQVSLSKFIKNSVII